MVNTPIGKEEIFNTLNNCKEYMENIADADHNGENFVPNKEMLLLVQIDWALEYVAKKEKELFQLREDKQHWIGLFQSANDKLGEQVKHLDYWKQRCEAAEAVINSCVNLDFIIMNCHPPETDYIQDWQQLKTQNQ